MIERWRRGREEGTKWRNTGYKRAVDCISPLCQTRESEEEHSWTVSRTDLNSSPRKFQRGCHSMISRWARWSAMRRVWMKTVGSTSVWNHPLLVLQLTIGGTGRFFYFTYGRVDPLSLGFDATDIFELDFLNDFLPRWLTKHFQRIRYGDR